MVLRERRHWGDGRGDRVVILHDSYVVAKFGRETAILTCVQTQHHWMVDRCAHSTGQVATIKVQFDTADALVLLKWDSRKCGDFFHPIRENELARYVRSNYRRSFSLSLSLSLALSLSLSLALVSVDMHGCMPAGCGSYADMFATSVLMASSYSTAGCRSPTPQVQRQ